MYYSGADTVAVTVLAIYFVVLGVLLLGWIASFVFRGIGMYKIGKTQGRTNSWLSFIPFARTYFHGELSGDIPLKKRRIKSPGIWLLVTPIIYGVIFAVLYFFLIISVVISAISSVSYERDYVLNSEMAGLFVVLIVFFIFAIIVSLLYAAIKGGLEILVNRQIYERYTTLNMATLHAVLGMILPLYTSICMFIFGRRAEQIMEENMAQRQTISEEQE